MQLLVETRRIGVNRRILFNLLANGWMGAIGLLFVPIYIRYLGIEAYGIIGLFTTLQALSRFFDLGLPVSINREVARMRVEEPHAIQAFVRTLETFYWPMSALIGAALFALLPAYITQWVRSSHTLPFSLGTSLSLIAVITVFQWPLSLYLSILLGLERQAELAIIQALVATIRALGAVVVLKFRPDLAAFFLWQLAITVLSAAIFIRVCRRWSPSGKREFDLRFLRKFGRFTAGMSLIGLLSIPLTQSDKVILFRVVTLESFGVYSLATTVAVSMYMIISAAYNALFPNFTRLVAEGNEKGLADAYRKGTRVVSAMLAPVGFLLIFQPQTVMRLWTGNRPLAEQAAPLLAMLSAAILFHGLAHVIGALQFAHGWTRLSAYVNAGALCICIPALYFSSRSFGAAGAAATMAALHAGMLAIHLVRTHRSFLRDALEWWPSDMLRTAGVAALPFAVFAAFAPDPVASRWLSGFIAFALVASSVAVVAAFNRDLWAGIVARFGWSKGLSAATP